MPTSPLDPTLLSPQLSSKSKITKTKCLFLETTKGELGDRTGSTQVSRWKDQRARQGTCMQPPSPTKNPLIRLEWGIRTKSKRKPKAGESLSVSMCQHPSWEQWWAALKRQAGGVRFWAALTPKRNKNHQLTQIPALGIPSKRPRRGDWTRLSTLCCALITSPKRIKSRYICPNGNSGFVYGQRSLWRCQVLEVTTVSSDSRSNRTVEDRGHGRRW